MNEASRFELFLLSERPRLVQLCARLSGNREAAEDLAQETLLQAWSHAERLQSWDQAAGWLSAIARNVCLHWSRRHYREQARLIQPLPRDVPTCMELVEQLPNDFDLELELEHAELATLLDRALAFLPTETRTVLVQKYVEELPSTQIAARLGVSENVVAVRIHRGKLAFRRVLANELRADAIAYGLIEHTFGQWHETRMWCLDCGQQRLLASIPKPPGTISFRCPRCAADPEVPMCNYRLTNSHFSQLLGGLARPKSILNRASVWAHGYFLRALENKLVLCTNCGAPANVHQSKDRSASALLEDPLFLYIECARCSEVVSSSFKGLVNNLPEVQRFWREQEQIRKVPHRQIEIDGRVAIVTSFESVQNTARLDIVAALDPFRLIQIHSTAHVNRNC